ncbi:hypothetical protein [Scytonema sp. NUACC21]
MVAQNPTLNEWLPKTQHHSPLIELSDQRQRNLLFVGFRYRSTQPTILLDGEVPPKRSHY